MFEDSFLFGRRIERHRWAALRSSPYPPGRPPQLKRGAASDMRIGVLSLRLSLRPSEAIRPAIGPAAGPSVQANHAASEGLCAPVPCPTTHPHHALRWWVRVVGPGPGEWVVLQRVCEREGLAARTAQEFGVDGSATGKSFGGAARAGGV